MEVFEKYAPEGDSEDKALPVKPWTRGHADRPEDLRPKRKPCGKKGKGTGATVESSDKQAGTKKRNRIRT